MADRPFNSTAERTASDDPDRYDVEIVAETPALRVVIITLDPGHRVPWHLHPTNADVFFCLEGPIAVQTRAPDAEHRLLPAQRCDVPARVPHQVLNLRAGERCRFLLVQGVGAYAFVPCPGLDAPAADPSQRRD